MAKKKQITLDGLATLIQGEFNSLREEVATKSQLQGVENRLDTLDKDFRELAERVATREDLRSFAASWAGEVIALQETVKNLQTRVATLEGKHHRRAA